MKVEDIEKQVSAIADLIVEDRRVIHKLAEIGFDTSKTLEYITKRIEELGMCAEKIGRGGIGAQIVWGEGKHILLRADVDALGMCENTGLEFAASNGNMHACGHDMHTAMLLGAMRIISNNKDKISGRITFIFQSAEEILEGAKDVIDSGLLSDDPVDAAIMIHVIVGADLARDSVVIASEGVGAPSADFFRITLKGKSSHGSAPHMGRDALYCAAKILDLISDVPTREVSPDANTLLTVGRFLSGTAANVMADSAVIEGTFRTTDDGARVYLQQRTRELCDGVCALYGIESRFELLGGCPTLVNDGQISRAIYAYVKELIGKNCVYSNELGFGVGGSEDFSYISHEVPSVMIGVLAGARSDGYIYSLHNPKVVFDERALKRGAAIYAWCAIKYLS